MMSSWLLYLISTFAGYGFIFCFPSPLTEVSWRRTKSSLTHLYNLQISTARDRGLMNIFLVKHNELFFFLYKTNRNINLWNTNIQWIFLGKCFTILIVNCVNDYKMPCFRELSGRMRINTLLYLQTSEVDVKNIAYHRVNTEYFTTHICHSLRKIHGFNTILTRNICWCIL